MAPRTWEAGLMARAKVSLAEIDKALTDEFTQRLGYDAKDHMMRATTWQLAVSRTGTRILRPRALHLLLS
jgi:hypothetical protein